MRKRIKIVTHSDAHGVCIGVSAMRRLLEAGHHVELYYRHPDTYEPKQFWGKTIKQLPLEGYDELIILAIPLDKHTSKKCLAALREISRRVPIRYIDYHETTFPFSGENLVIEKRPSPVECYFQGQDRLTFLGAVCWRDRTVAGKASDEDTLIAEGIDYAIKNENEVNRELTIAKLRQEDWEWFKTYSGCIPRLNSCRIGNVSVVDTSNSLIQAQNVVFKAIEKAIIEQETPYGLGIYREVPSRQNAEDKEDVLTIIRYWKNLTHPSVRETIEKCEHPVLKRWQKTSFYAGKEDNFTIRIPSNPKDMAELAVAMVETFSQYDASEFMTNIGRRIAVGGAPNSGKSSFVYSLEYALQRIFGIAAYAPDLDLMSPTKVFIYGEIPWELREKYKLPKWTPELASKARQQFETAPGELIIGDTPGKIDAITEQIIAPADSALIICQKQEDIDEWRRFFETHQKKVISTFLSTKKSPSQVLSDNGLHHISHLDRHLYPYNPIILTLAMFIANNTHFS